MQKLGYWCTNLHWASQGQLLGLAWLQKGKSDIVPSPAGGPAELGVSLSADRCCRHKACLYSNVYIFLKFLLQGVFPLSRISGIVLPAKANDSLIFIKSIIHRSKNMSSDPQQYGGWYIISIIIVHYMHKQNRFRQLFLLCKYNYIFMYTYLYICMHAHICMQQ